MPLSLLEQEIINLRAHAEVHDHMLFALFNGLLPANTDPATRAAFVDNVLFRNITSYLAAEAAKSGSYDEGGRALVEAMIRHAGNLRASTREAFGLPPERTA